MKSKFTYIGMTTHRSSSSKQLQNIQFIAKSKVRKIFKYSKQKSVWIQCSYPPSNE